jgi:hypothetical protein
MPLLIPPKSDPEGAKEFGRHSAPRLGAFTIPRLPGAKNTNIRIKVQLFESFR